MTLAVERFVMVVLPLKASTILTKRNRLVAYFSVTIFSTGLSVAEAVFHVRNGHSGKACEMFPSTTLRLWSRNLDGSIAYASLASAVLLYLVPAVVSTGLYARVGIVLLKRRQQASRNKVLTVALLFSCFFWIVLWGMAYFLRFSEIYFDCALQDLFICLTGEGIRAAGVSGCTPSNQLWDELKKTSTLLATFSAVMNAACLLIVCKKFWEPVTEALGSAKSLGQKIKEKLK